MIDVLEIIREITDKKREDKIEPTNATWSEVSKAVEEKTKQEINQLITDKKLIFHKTLNSFSFGIAENDQHNQNNNGE